MTDVTEHSGDLGFFAFSCRFLLAFTGFDAGHRLPGRRSQAMDSNGRLT
jgi:hypothetical protein